MQERGGQHPEDDRQMDDDHALQGVVPHAADPGEGALADSDEVSEEPEEKEPAQGKERRADLREIGL